MVICKFFQQGHCRYGERCWNEHPGGTGYGGEKKQISFHDSFSTQNRFSSLGQGQQSQQIPAKNVSLKDLNARETVDVLCKEIELWEKSKMWPFSCVGIAKEATNLQGFEDISFEEMRLEAYTAKIANTLPALQQKLQQMHAEYRTKREQIMRPTYQVKQQLINAIEQVKQGTKDNSGLFGSTQSAPSGLFGSTQSTLSGLLGSTQSASSGLFGQTASSTQSSVFGQPTNQSSGGFGQSAQSSSTFGQSTAPASNAFSSSGAFVQPANTSTVFGQTATTGSTATGLFGKSPITPSTGLFSKPADSSSTGLFGKPADSSSTGLFGKPADSSTGLFGKPADSSTGLFGKPADSSSTGLFGKPADSSTGLFGKPAGNSQGGFGQTTFGATSSAGIPAQTATVVTPSNKTPGSAQTPIPQIKSQIYTPLDQLTKEEKEQFEATKFTLGKIPTRPPPKELC